MNHKVFRSVFVLAVALGLVSVMVRIKDNPKPPPQAAAETPQADPMSRALASYRVNSTETEKGADFSGANYKASVTEEGFVFGSVPEKGSQKASREFSIEFGNPRIEQGPMKLECQPGRVVRPSQSIAQIDRGVLTEEYLFENRRVEQIFRFPTSLGEGALRICIPVKSDLGGPVVTHEPRPNEFVDLKFRYGGLAFCDAAGATKAAYYSAIAIDAEGRRANLMPKHVNNEVILEVPAEFMAMAAYPLVVDPWLDTGNISSNGGASQKPAISKGGARFAIAWSDNSNGNYEIFVKVGNGFDLIGISGSDTGGGISGNSGSSVNPSIAVDSAGNPAVAWQDTSSGFVAIYCKQMPARNQPGAGTWVELSGSATGAGLSGTAGASVNPSLGLLDAVIPGVVTTDPSTGITSSTPPKFLSVPVVAWSEGNGSLYCKAFYPGQPAHPADVAVPAFPIGQAAVPPGWYQLGQPNGVGVTADIFQPAARVNLSAGLHEYPSLVVDGSNRVCVAWQSTINGNYDIHFRRHTYTGAPASNNFFIQSDAALQGFNMQPPANFRDITGANTDGTVSGTSTPSQHPSLATNGVDQVIAWEETESAAPPTPPGVTSQIYVARSNGVAAFGALGTSLAAGGISRTLNRATYPSADMNGSIVDVAWADDSNGRSSIYVREFVIGGPATWNTIGFQGSAFPPSFLGEAAPIAGVSQSTNYALQPQINAGGPTVIWADGSGSTFDILGKSFVPNAPGTAAGVGSINPTFGVLVSQTQNDPRIATPVPVTIGGFSAGTTVFLWARVFTETLVPPSNTLRLEFEIQPAGALFTGTPTHQSLFVAPDSPAVTPANLAVLKFDGLPNFNYHWLARTIDEVGRHSPWISPGEVGGVSFRINASAAAGGTGPVNNNVLVVSTRSKGSCGLTGLEGLALLAALRLIRRRRAK